MPPAKRDPASILDAILDRVPRMKTLRITQVTFDGVSITLAPPDPGLDGYLQMQQQADEYAKKKREKADATDDEPPPADEADPLNDRATYAGGRVPGFTRPKKEPM